jgi:predicted RNA-binding Zn-ribbon protein involved in translation (DUF1610 family)
MYTKKLITALIFIICCILSVGFGAACLVPTEDYQINTTTYLCGGTYLLNDSNEDGSLKINGNSLILDCNSSRLVGNLTGWMVKDDIGHYNVTIKNCYFENTTVSVAHSNYTYIYNNTFNESNNMLHLSACEQCLIENNSIYNGQDEGILVEYFGGSNHSIMRGNYFEYGYGGLTVYDGYNITVEDNTFVGLLSNKAIEIAGGSFEITIRNSNITNGNFGADGAIRLSTSDDGDVSGNITISTNTLVNVTRWIIAVDDNVSNVVVDSNVIEGGTGASDESCFYYYGTGVVLENSNITFRNNNCTGTAIGITMHNLNNSRIFNNTFVDIKTAVLYATANSSGNLFYQNNVYPASGCVLYTNGTTANVNNEFNKSTMGNWYNLSFHNNMNLSDADADGIYDTALTNSIDSFISAGFQGNYPYMCKDGWVTNTTCLYLNGPDGDDPRTSVIFNYIVGSNEGPVYNCSLFHNFSGTYTENQTNFSVSNSVLQNFSLVLSQNDHLEWNVHCYTNSSAIITNSKNYSVTQFNTLPVFGNISLPILKDNMLLSGYAWLLPALLDPWNFGGSETNVIGFIGLYNSTGRITMEINISGVPDNATINNVTLYILQNDTDGLGDTAFNNVSLFRLTSSWNEGTSTGASNDATINGSSWHERWFGLNWTTYGGDFDNSTTYDRKNLDGSAVDRLINWSLTSLVNEWYAGTYDNYGFIFVADNETGDPSAGGGNSIILASRENAANPTFAVANISFVSNLTWDENTNLNQVFDLDDFFSDVDTVTTLSYTVEGENESQVNITIDSDNNVSFIPAEDWNGAFQIYFVANDTVGTATSNNITLNVLEVPVVTQSTSGGGSPNQNTVMKPKIEPVVDNGTLYELSQDEIVLLTGTECPDGMVEVEFQGDSYCTTCNGQVKYDLDTGRFYCGECKDGYIFENDKCVPVVQYTPVVGPAEAIQNLIIQYWVFILVGGLAIYAVHSAYQQRKKRVRVR